MQYKTIILELIRSRPDLHRRLKDSKTLLATVEHTAILLKASHEAWMEELRGTRPGSDSAQIASEALEIALKVIEETLPDGSRPDDAEPRFLGDAMATLLGKTPTD
jgi:hypothetical protein